MAKKAKSKPTEVDTVKALMKKRMAELTASERHLASALMEDYPIAGLQSITELAQVAQVSTPTVVRMARKLGFEGFSALQEALRNEISAQIKKPMAKLDEISAKDFDSHSLYRYSSAVFANLQGTLARIDQAEFDVVAGLLADPDRAIFVEGGRITRSLADYLFNHLQIVRPKVMSLEHSPAVWPQFLVDMNAASVLVLFDIRRYESNLLKLAKLAKERGCTIVLFTDQWGSPIGQHADHTLQGMGEVPSSFDSTLAQMLLLETLIAEVQIRMAGPYRARIEELESMYSATRIFMDFS